MSKIVATTIWRYSTSFRCRQVCYHSVNDIGHLRYVFFNCAEYNISVNFKIVMGNLIAHTHHSTPINLRIAGEQLSMSLLV